jgi:DNA adenine methylase
LLDEYVDFIALNDLDPAVAAFWRSVFWRTEDLIRVIRSTPVSIATWHSQREIIGEPAGHDDLLVGFALFFLNRTNRSGILDARPIGGLRQSGPWRLDARYSSEQLISRIETLGRYRNRVTVEQRDGKDVLRDYLGRGTFAYVDPPYLLKGSDLYLNRMEWADHVELSQVLRGTRSQWLLTYDEDPRVAALFPRHRRAVFAIAHTAAKQHIGRELAVFSNGLDVTDLTGLGRQPVVIDNRAWYAGPEHEPT